MSQQAMHTHTTVFSGSVGWCGLGAMGAAMAPRLLAVTDRLSGYDINKDAGQNLGLQRAEQLAELATTDIVITMLPDGRAVREVAETLLAAGFSGLLADMSSCHPQDSRALAADLAASGCRFIDAPVSGGVAKAASGELMIMAGGAETDIEQARPLLARLGTVQPVGPVGAGHAMKALNNYVSAAGLLASFQALATAKGAGIAPETFVNVINGSTGRNNTTEVKLEKFILNEAFNSGFALQLMAKDVNIACQLIEAAGHTVEATPALAACLDEAVASLGVRADHTELYRYVTDDLAQEGGSE